MTSPQSPARRPPVSWWALAGALFAMVSVTLELLGSVLGDSPTSSYPAWLITRISATVVAVPFAVFAAGIALGMPWATFH